MKTIELTKEEIDRLVSGECIELYVEKIPIGSKYLSHDGDCMLVAHSGRFKIKKKVEKWEPNAGIYSIEMGDDYPVKVTDTDYPNDRLSEIEPMYREAGLLRKTEEQAERAAKKMRTFNRLLAYVDEFDPYFKFTDHSLNYYISRHHESNIYEYNNISTDEIIGVVYMSQEVAKELCRKLNSGEVCL